MHSRFSSSQHKLVRCVAIVIGFAISCVPSLGPPLNQGGACMRLRGGNGITSLRRKRPYEKKKLLAHIRQKQRKSEEKKAMNKKNQEMLNKTTISKPPDFMDFDQYFDDVRSFLRPIVNKTAERRIMHKYQRIRARGFKPGEYVALKNSMKKIVPSRGQHIRFTDETPKKTSKKSKAELKREQRQRKQERKKQKKEEKRMAKNKEKLKKKQEEAKYKARFELMKAIVQKLQTELKDAPENARDEISFVLQAIHREDFNMSNLNPLQQRISAIIHTVISERGEDQAVEASSETIEDDNSSLDYIPGPHRRTLELDESSFSDLSTSEDESEEEGCSIGYDRVYRTHDGRLIFINISKESLQERKFDKRLQRQMDRWRKGLSTVLNAGVRPKRLENVPYTKDEAAESLESDNSDLLGRDYMSVCWARSVGMTRSLRSNFGHVEKKHVEAEDEYHFQQRVGMPLQEFLSERKKAPLTAGD
eukprot:757120-Hanusia_phi.AAC.2